MVKTNALRVDNNPENKRPRSSKSYKWDTILNPIWYNRKNMRERELVLFRVILMHC